MNYATARDALQVLADLLRNELEYSPAMSVYDGVRVVFADDESQAADGAGPPRIVLNVEEDAQSDVVILRRARAVTISAIVEANDFSGAKTGISNPEAADTQLSKLLAETLRDKRAELRDAGLLRLTMRAQTERVNEAQFAPGTHENPHRIEFIYMTP
jgi:hypothetical protein